MSPDDSVEELERYVMQRTGKGLADLTPRTSAEILVDFMRDVPARGCSRDDGGDMLVFRWGVREWHDGERFDLDITRQFTSGSGEEAATSQLSLTFSLQPDWELRSLGKGELWCCGQKELESFRRAVAQCGVHAAVGSREDATVDVSYTYVEQAGGPTRGIWTPPSRPK